ncbi:MAG: hypothetical protein AAB508_05825, partial [Patescibacteria group bacterium]
PKWNIQKFLRGLLIYKLRADAFAGASGGGDAPTMNFLFADLKGVVRPLADWRQQAREECSCASSITKLRKHSVEPPHRFCLPAILPQSRGVRTRT